MYSFSYLEPVCCSMSSSDCCFLICIQVSQEAGQMIWYSHLFQNFPQFIVIHTVKGFGIVNKAEIDVFRNYLAFSMIQRMLAIWSLVPLPFLKVHGSRIAEAWLGESTIVKVKVTLSCPTLCDPVDYTAHGILQARILGVSSFSLLWGFFPTQGSNPGLPHCRQILHQLRHKYLLKMCISTFQWK